MGTDTYVNVMAHYSPAGQVGANPKYEAINRRTSREEYTDAVRTALAAGLHRLDDRAPLRLSIPL